MVKRYLRGYLFLFLTGFALIVTGCGAGQNTIQEIPQKESSVVFDPVFGLVDLDTVKAGRFDNGKMWTFEYPPLDYFQEEYGFRPTEEWLNKAKTASLKFATYCSASFISEDGLIMTNHHCSEGNVAKVTKEGENLQREGFFAATLEEERKVPGLFVDQVQLIVDITDKIEEARAKGNTPEEKDRLVAEARELIQKTYEEATGLIIKTTPLYNGGRYSLYGYKRYSDIRLVFAPEMEIGNYGGDYDNFTFPRFNLDFTFYRAYDEDGKPLKVDTYFSWNKEGVKSGDPVFVIGNPGSTNRLKTMSQLEYSRDVSYPYIAGLLRDALKVLELQAKMDPENADEYKRRFNNLANSRKVFEGQIAGLQNKYLMARKKAFEDELKSKVKADDELTRLYGDLWKSLNEIVAEKRVINPQLNSFSFRRWSNSTYFENAQILIDIAREQKNATEKLEQYQGPSLDTLVMDFYGESFSKEIEDFRFQKQIENIVANLGSDHKVAKELFGGKNGEEAVEYLLNKSFVDDPVIIKEKILAGGDAILNSGDPLIEFMLIAEQKRTELAPLAKTLDELEDQESEKLGQLIFDIYGHSVPPDATFTLRIADGVVESYPYNGTIAQINTTFYGLYERHYGHKGKEPWSLPEKWINPPTEFDLETPVNFISTNDITGGSSGSPVVNQNLEIVGVAFDGNIESLPGDFIFTTYQNRTISVSALGMYESIGDLYKANRIIQELSTGKIPEDMLVNSNSKPVEKPEEEAQIAE